MISALSSSQTPVTTIKSPLDSTDSKLAPRTQKHAMEYHAFIRTLRQDTTSMSSATVDFDTAQALRRQDQATQENPPTTLTFFDVSSIPASPTAHAPLLPSVPTTPAPVLHRPSICETLSFDVDEIRHIFPAELPPRPPHQHGFFARMFKREPRFNAIELGRTPESHRLRGWSTLLSRRQNDHLLCWGVGWILIIGLVAWITLTEIHKGNTKYSEDNGQW
jgi:hypothetical protein